MDQDALADALAALPGVSVLVASEAGGAPEVSWGDRFFYHDPDGARDFRRQPFATIVVNDYPGFDEASDLARRGLFRLNVHVGRELFEQLLGYEPGEQPARHDTTDYSVCDTVLPHPTYARQGWISIVAPGASTGASIHELIAAAHRRAAGTSSETAAPGE